MEENTDAEDPTKASAKGSSVTNIIFWEKETIGMKISIMRGIIIEIENLIFITL